MRAVPMIMLHLAPLAVVWTGARGVDWIVCGLLFFLRMLFFSALMHRYFCHRAFKTSRWAQFAMAVLSTLAGLRSPLWFASVHSVHHQHSDTDLDVHSPRRGLFHSHLGWLLCPAWDRTDLARVPYFATFPELVWLDRFWLVPPALLAASVLFIGGFSMLVVGFFLSTLILFHIILCGASLAHMVGSRRFNTPDDSRNFLLLGLISCGEGFHNNHHYRPRSSRLGVSWWELDLSYGFIVLLERLKLVWDVKRRGRDVSTVGVRNG